MRIKPEALGAAVLRLNPQLTGISADAPKFARAPEPVEREAELHHAILDWCAARGLVALHGSMAHRTRRTLGEPDFVILAPHGRVVLVECKLPGRKLSAEQNALARRAQLLGHVVHVARDMDEFEKILNMQ